MVDIMDVYNTININFRAVIRNPVMLKFVLDHLTTKQISNYAVKKLPFIVRYVPVQ